jgi:hypothetical protein
VRQDLANIGVLQRDLDRLCARMRAKGSVVRFAYGPCGYSVYRYLTAKGLIVRCVRLRSFADRPEAG